MIALLTALTALGSISVSIYLPSLPSLAVSLHTSAASVKLSLTVFLFVFALSQLAYGPLSDRYGRKPPILAGLAIYIVGSIACGAAPNIYVLIAARAIQALGAAAGPALGRAVLRDLYTGEQLTGSLATVAAAVALSPMLGPALGGYLQVAFGWRSCFVFLALAGAALFSATWRRLPESHEPKPGEGLNARIIARNYATLLSDREYVSALLCGGMLTAGNFAWTAGAPFVFKALYHFSPAQYGNVALAVGGGYVLGTLAGGRLSQHWKAPTLVYAGMALALGCGVALNFVPRGDDSYPTVIACMFVYTIGMGIVTPMSAACALSRHPEIAGAAAGLLGALQILTGVLGTLAIGAVGKPSIPPIAAIVTVTSVLSLIAAYVALLSFRNTVVSARSGIA
jgi:DHA1 family bicyclomycin/chloramphenicol resistance-like MFS transporter